ncbi:YTH domain-containing family protein 2-like [Phalaenopsis equestris]|uniref:YTH domain-containing family protein 2-like n=1 Tax=Phalaenopsis equestris TaxID=78828 RepID=UPI0009E3BE87|nr:YTH domain-containing family protein 2-like [Phalaenopsis equestris]
MDGEAVPELIFDQNLGLYYPAVTDYYGYYYTGPEPTISEWDSHQFFGQDPHISAVQAENLQNVYYLPTYGYLQSPYNPYNPSIPGAVLGTETSFMETNYPSNPPHQLVVSSPAYIPIGINSSSDTVPNSYLNPLLTSTSALPAIKPDGEIKKLASPLVPHFSPLNRSQASLVAAPEHLVSNTLQPSSGHSHTIPMQKEVSVANLAPAKQSSVGSFINGGIHGINQGVNQLSNLKVPSVYRPAKVTVPPNNGYTSYPSDLNQWTAANTGDRFRPTRFQFGGPWVNRNGNLPEQNRGPRSEAVKCQWVSPLSVKAYTTKAGAVDAEGNIVISADQFNRDDFPVDYEAAKFFVIKSYSEDDVHKSIKYNVWSSTPSGNKRLDNAFEEAHKLSLGRAQKCPIFLFFSVNASGQFCGVAEMSGSVDFQKDMDFWQQDKWLGSFPVKWHVVKDVSNTSLRHILLENNEYKPVTCSRDTQEIPFIQGMAMLRIFKAASSETSLLDDFLLYEDRQRKLIEEKFRISGRRQNVQFFPSPPPPPPVKTAPFVVLKETALAAAAESSSATPGESLEKEVSSTATEEPRHAEPDERETSVDQNSGDPSSPKAEEAGEQDSKMASQSPTKATNLVILGHSKDQFDDGVNSIMKIGSLLIDSKASEEDPSLGSRNDVITVGSMHIKVGKAASPP